MICDWLWLAWLQLLYWAVVFIVLASNGVTVLLLVPLASDSRILSVVVVVVVIVIVVVQIRVRIDVTV